MDVGPRRSCRFKKKGINNQMKEINVAFASEKVKEDFEKLTNGKFEDKKLSSFIQRAINDLKINPSCGTKISRKLWPDIYIKNHNVNNLWKYDLPNAWRLIYTIKTTEIEILSVLLEWFDHKSYEKRFGY